MQDYFDVIDTPMDFGTICSTIKLGRKYKDSKDVYKDVELIWNNCCKYNKNNSYVVELMKRVKNNFMKHWNAAGLYREQPETNNGEPEFGLLLYNFHLRLIIFFTCPKSLTIDRSPCFPLKEDIGFFGQHWNSLY